MFERFSQEARLAVIDAQRHAREAGSGEISAEHLALALLWRDDDAGRYLVERLGDAESLAARFRDVQRRAGITSAEARALDEIGIDIDQVVEAVERTHGENALASGRHRGRFPWLRHRRTGRPASHIPFTPESKRVLAQSLQEAVALGDRHIGGEHLLFALLTLPGTVHDVFAEAGIDYLDARRALRSRGGPATAG